MTRQQEVLERLEAGGWIDGPDLANAEVGGSEGLKRLRELRAEGRPIERRRHPDPRRDIWQYRLAGVGVLSREFRAASSKTPPDAVLLCPDHSGKGCVLCGGVGLVERVQEGAS